MEIWAGKFIVIESRLPLGWFSAKKDYHCCGDLAERVANGNKVLEGISFCGNNFYEKKYHNWSITFSNMN